MLGWERIAYSAGSVCVMYVYPRVWRQPDGRCGSAGVSQLASQLRAPSALCLEHHRQSTQGLTQLSLRDLPLHALSLLLSVLALASARSMHDASLSDLVTT